MRLNLVRYEETVEEPVNNRERRRYPRVVINLPLEYQEKDDFCLLGATLVNVSEGGFLIECTRNIPVGTELNITVLVSKAFDFANFKAVTKIVWKERYSKENSNGDQYRERYLYGLEFI